MPPMQTLVIEFDSRQALDDAINHLWDKLAVTGEMLSQRVDEGCWRLELVLEQSVRGPTLEKIGGRVVKS